MSKIKTKKALLKRVKVTGSGRVKFSRAFGRHKRSHKSGTLLRSYRRPSYMKSSEIRRIRIMLNTGVSA